MASDFSFDVFLCYNAADKHAVRWLAERLRDAGLRVWFDEWVIQPGEDIDLGIERGLAATRTLVLCLSPAALGPDWVSLERRTVLFRDPVNVGRRFVPLLLASCDLPDTLRRYKHIDVRDKTDSAFEELLAACRPDAEPANKTPSVQLPGKWHWMHFEHRALLGHTRAVSGLAVSPDGSWMVSLARQEAIVWDLDTRKARATLDLGNRHVFAIAISPDGTRIVAAAIGRLLVWDVNSQFRLTVLDEMANVLTSLAVVITADSRCAVSSFDELITIWDLATGLRTPTRLIGHVGLIESMAVVGTTKRVMVAGDNGTIALWDLESDERMLTFEGHHSAVYSIVVSPDARRAVSGSADKTVKIWDIESGACLGTLEGHHGPIVDVAVSPDGALIASACPDDRTVRIWDMQSGECETAIARRRHFHPTSVAFGPRGGRLYIGDGRKRGRILVHTLSPFRVVQRPVPTRRYVNAKVVLVGESGVGKSALAHRLIDDAFVHTSSTHGMQVWRLDLPLPPDDELEREVLLWDLAGQEDARLIHQLFLDDTALALLLFDPQQDDPFAEIEVWLKVLRGTGVKTRDIVKLLVAARIDTGQVKVSQRKIDRFRAEQDIAGFLPTSAMRGDNCSDRHNGDRASALKQLITQHIPWAALPWTSTPRLLAELKNAVLAMTERKDVRLLRFAELAQRLEQALPNERFEESDVRTAVRLLANHGLVKSLEFGDLVLLRPALLNGYASAVIRAAREHTDEIGSVSEQAVFNRTIDFTGVHRLDPPDEELFVRAIVQTFLDCSLCIAADTPHGRHLIFPSQFRRERPIPAHPAIFVSYTFSGELQTIYTTLVVRLWYSGIFDQRELWRDAAEFETLGGDALGLVMERTRDGEGTLSVFFATQVADDLKVIFIEYVHRHLARYARDVRRDRRYVCSACAQPVTDLDAIRKRLDAKRDFITCQICDHRIPLIDHIERRLATDPVAQRVLRMDRKAARELDTQALEQILIGHMMAICGEANQIFRELTQFDYGIDGEVEFKDNDGGASGRKIYVQLKSGASYLRRRKADRKEVFDVKNPRHLDYWLNQPVDVYLVIRDRTETIRWMNLTAYLRDRPSAERDSRQIIFKGERLDAPAIWRVRDQFFGRRPAGTHG